MIARCTCRNEYQDKRYGEGMRVVNPVGKTVKSGRVMEGRCTSCKAILEWPGSRETNEDGKGGRK